MDLETSSSVDEGSEYDDPNTFNYIHDSDDEECGLADAFMQFEAQAEKRTQELLKATDQQLFRLSQQNNESTPENAEERGYPAYMYMSDQFRLKKPPQFQHWQQNFQYSQVTGSRMLEGESMEHVQLVPMEEKGVERESDVENVELQVGGRVCLQEPTVECRNVYEEIILCDGVMEETLDRHEDADDEMHMKTEFGRISPHCTHVDEMLDELTMECFSSMVAPMLTSLYKAMLEKQQLDVRTAREEREAAANRIIEEQVAFEKARQLQLEQEALEEAARIEALEQQRQEEERKEVARREQLLKQQLEENDEEEVKIKMLAYSHTREWYQPNKKCFSHRGRQLTYLKPVLQSKSEDVSLADSQERSPPPSTARCRKRQFNVLKKPRSGLQKPQPEWVTGGALTNDKLCDISWVKKIARPPAIPPPSPTHSNRSRQRRKNENQKDDASSSGGVQLPIIPKPGAKTKIETLNPTSNSAKSAVALKTYPASSNQVPLRVTVEGSRNKDCRSSYSANAVK